MELLLISLDEEYVNLVEGTLARSLSSKVNISVISDIKYLSEYCKHEVATGVLIVDEKCISYIEKIRANKVLIITEKNDSREDSVYKYGGAQALLRAIPLEYIRKGGDGSLKETKIIKVATATGGSGKTTTAIGVARAFFEMGRKVLYINSENIQDFPYLLCNKEHLKDEVIRVMTKPAAVSADYVLNAVVNEGFDYLPAVSGMLSSWQITVNTLLDIAKEIAGRKLYDYIVVELPKDVVDRDAFKIHDNEMMILTALQDNYSFMKTSGFISIMGYREENCVVVCNMVRNNEEISFGREIEGCSVCDFVNYDRMRSDVKRYITTATAVG